MSSLTPRLDKLEKNHVINGGFDFWQRGTSFTVNAGGSNRVYDADRWSSTNYFNAGQFTVSRQTDVPSSLYNQVYSRKFLVGTTITFSNSYHYAGTTHAFEGAMIKPLIGKVVTLSFWVKSTVAGAYSLMFSAGNYDSLTSRYLTTYTVNAINTWEKKSVSLTLDSSLAFTKDNTMGLAVMWPLAANSGALTSTANTWLPSSSAYALSTANRTDMLTAGNSFQLAGVSLHEGQISDPDFSLAGRDYLEELQLCQRYYEKSFAISQAPANGGASSFVTDAGQYAGYSLNSFSSAFCPFIVEKRATPSLTGYGNSSGYWQNQQTSYDVNTFSGLNVSTKGFTISQQSVAAYVGIRGHWTADAEL